MEKTICQHVVVAIAVCPGCHALFLRGFRRVEAGERLAPVLRLVDERFEARCERLDIRQRQRERAHERVGMRFRVLAERRALRAAQQEVGLQHHRAERAVRIWRRMPDFGAGEQALRLRIVQQFNADAVDVKLRRAVRAVEPFDPVFRGERRELFLEFHVCISSTSARFNKATLATEICGLLILPFFGASPAPT